MFSIDHHGKRIGWKNNPIDLCGQDAKKYRGKERKGKNISTHPSWKDTIQGSGEGMEETLRTGT